MAQFGRALRSGRRGRKFESCHSDFEKELAGILLNKDSGIFYVKFVYPVYKKAKADYNETVVKFMQREGQFYDTELLFAKYK